MARPVGIFFFGPAEAITNKGRRKTECFRLPSLILLLEVLPYRTVGPVRAFLEIV